MRPALFGNLRARDYDVVYLGYNGDGQIGRINLTASAYGAFGQDRHNVFTGRNAPHPALLRRRRAEHRLRLDPRPRLPACYASGDGNPYDNVERGFDAIFENPIFAGADTSYWIRQTIPFAGGGRAVALNGRNGILNSLRSSKEQGQSNFNNPGTMLLGVGADFDITPELRLSANANHLWFAEHRRAAGAAHAGHDPQRHRLGLVGGGDLAAARRPRTSSSACRARCCSRGTGFRDLFANQRPRPALLFGPAQRDRDLLMRAAARP